MDLATAKVIGAGLAAIGVGAAAIGVGFVFGSFLQSSLRNPADLAEFQVSKMLNANPDPGPKHGEHESERTASWPKQEKAEQRKQRRINSAKAAIGLHPWEQREDRE